MDAIELKNMLRKFPKIELVNHITPIQRLSNYEKELRKNNLFLKRDDLNGVGAGGNKIRNLEYLLGDAIFKGADIIIASGTKDSNLCSLTANACSKIGIDYVLVHNSIENKQDSGNMRLNSIIDANRIFLGNTDEKERNEYVLKLAKEYKEKSRKPYIIKNGATSTIGALGYVDAVIELTEQREKYLFDDICVSGGNGGLATGLVFGSGLLNIPFHINIITVENEKNVLLNIIEDLVVNLEKYTGVQLKHDLNAIMTIHDEYRGDGWAKPTIESDEMIYEFAKKEAIYLENVYVSKTIYGMIDLIKKGVLKDNVCGIHSGGFPSVFSQDF